MSATTEALAAGRAPPTPVSVWQTFRYWLKVGFIRFAWRSAAVHLAVGLVVWVTADGVPYVTYGWHGPLTQMGRLSTMAALVTFGGAYAVLPCVYQGGIDHYGWLTAAQMIDSLALGEPTPGPLIMVVAFVGFGAAGPRPSSAPTPWQLPASPAPRFGACAAAGLGYSLLMG